MQVIPSKEQEAILQSRAATLMIEARAGTGKTTTLALLAAQEPGLALGLCFSDGAQSRLEEKLAEEAPQRRFTVLTLDGLARSLLNRLIQGRYFEKPQRIYDEEQLRPMLIEAADAVWLRYSQRGGSDFDFGFAQRGARIEGMLQLLTTLKASLASLEFDDEEFDDYALEELAIRFNVQQEEIAICREFERRRQPQQGFYLWQARDDLVTDLVGILRRHPEALDDLPLADLLLVDEWHDVNAAEFALLQLFRRSARLIVVGDRYQVINAQRGADLRFSGEDFERAYPAAQRLPLHQSRRCGVSISHLLAKVLPGSGFDSHPETYSELRRIAYDQAASHACASAVAERVQALEEEKVRLSDIALVLRDADQSVELENQLLDRELAYRCEGLQSYLLRPEILFLRTLLHYACGDYASLKGLEETCAKMADSLVLYFAVRYDSSAFDAEHEIYGSGSGIEQAREALCNTPDDLKFFCESFVLGDNPALGGGSPWKARLAQLGPLLRERAQTDNAGQLIELVIETIDLAAVTRSIFVSRSRADSVIRTIGAFAAYARDTGLSATDFLKELRTRQERTGAAIGSKSGRQRAQLVLTTVHAAKGKEWPQVLLPYLEAGQFPRTRDLPQEQRCLYVAASRAITGLTLFIPADEARRSTLLG